MWTRKLVVALTALVGAIVLGLFVNLVDLSDPAAYALGGAAVAVLVLLGVPYAFGIDVIRGQGVGIEQRNNVDPNEGAVRASQHHGGQAVSHRDAFTLWGGVEQDSLIELRPTVISTHRADALGATLDQYLSEAFEVGHQEILRPIVREDLTPTTLAGNGRSQE